MIILCPFFIAVSARTRNRAQSQQQKAALAEQERSGKEDALAAMDTDPPHPEDDNESASVDSNENSMHMHNDEGAQPPLALQQRQQQDAEEKNSAKTGTPSQGPTQKIATTVCKESTLQTRAADDVQTQLATAAENSASVLALLATVIRIFAASDAYVFTLPVSVLLCSTV
jgi:hypothetical protein